MQEKEKLKLNAEAFGSRGYPRAARSPARPGPRPEKKERMGRVYLGLRLFVCALLLMGAIGLKLKGEEGALAVMGEPDYENGEEDRSEETMGRLKFVSLPSIAEVFAKKPAALMPCEAVGTERISSSELAFLTERGTELVSPVSGRVEETGGEGEGAFVRIAAEDGSEFTLTGVSESALETGRPVGAGQRIGLAFSSRILVRVAKNGLPVDPAAVFGLS